MRKNRCYITDMIGNLPNDSDIPVCSKCKKYCTEYCCGYYENGELHCKDRADLLKEFEELFGKDAENASDTNHPPRYNGNTPTECYKVLKAWMSPEEYKGWLKGNCIKYLCRLGKKDEESKELDKASWYLNKLVEEYKKSKK